VTARSLARRYALGLFDTVVRSGGAERVARELAAARDLLAGHLELRRALETPVVPPQKKRAILEAVLDHAGGVGRETRALLAILAEHDQTALLPEVVKAFEAALAQAGEALPADVVTAAPLTPHDRERLAKALARAIGRAVTIRERVDPSIVAGVVARVGSLVFDGSVAHQINRLRQRLLAQF
jgi:F-type H+-transporting ATPase subunit delta